MPLEDRVDDWRRILSAEGQLVVAAVEAAGEPGPAGLARLRRDHPRALVEVALELVAARRRGEGKLPGIAELLVDQAGVEQATGHPVAAHKARRFAGAPRVVDLCCGVGGDAMALAAVAGELLVVDRSPVRVLMAGHNAKVPGRVQDLADFAPDPTAWLHLDPSRRDEGTGRRHRRYADYEPGPEVIEPMLAAAKAAAVKLGPGVDWRELPRRSDRELEFISLEGTLVQAVMWCGALCRSPGEHTGTRLSTRGGSGSPEPLTFTAPPDPVLPVDEEGGRFLLVPDPALARGHLVAPRIAGTGAAELAPGLGLLTCDEPLGDPWFEEHEILARLPWREPKIRAWLRDHDGGPVSVRTRDGAVQTDRCQVALRGGGNTGYTLFGLRLGRRVACLVTGGAR